VEDHRPSCGCQARLRALARIRSAAAYEGPLERALHRFKYEGWRALAPTLAGLMVDALPEPIETTGERATLLAVPLHRRRLRERGYNQSELLAEELRRRWPPPATPGRLVRLRDTPPQVGLDRPRRRQNVAGAFGWVGPDLAGRPILLVDDVATTGSTLEACGRALRAAGAGRIEAVTVARVSV
jgi:ComF family protein